MAQFQINFADPKGFYFPGEIVSGNVTVSLRKTMTFHELTIKFKGKSYCHWSEGSGDNRKSYHNREEYFKAKVILLTGASSDNISLIPGEYNYPFSFALPINLPPTFEASLVTGYVRYYMQVSFDMGSILKADQKTKIPFNVVALSPDLNLTPALLEPANGVKEKLLCCLCCQSGPIRLQCQINKQAFYIGEPIIFSVEVDNRETDKQLRNVEVKLIKEVVLICHSRRKWHHSAVSSVILTNDIQPRGEDSWQNMQLNIPTDTMPSFDNCSCVNVNYQFCVEVDIPSAIDTCIKFPIRIANGVQTSQPFVNLPPTHVLPVQAPGMMHQQAYPPPIAVQPPFMDTQPPPPYPFKDF